MSDITARREDSAFARFAARFIEDRVALFGLALLVLIIAVAVFAPLIAPQNPYDLGKVDIMDSRQPPGAKAGDGFTMWLG